MKVLQKLGLILIGAMAMIMVWFLSAAETPQVMILASWQPYDTSIAPNDQVTHIRIYQTSPLGQIQSVIADSVNVTDTKYIFPWPADGKALYIALTAVTPFSESDISNVESVVMPDHRQPSAVENLVLEILK